MRVMKYDEVKGKGLSERKKSFNVQCYCDVREFECIARFLVSKGLEVPIKASTVMNELIHWVSEQLIRQKKMVINHTPSEALKSLRRMGLSTAQFRGGRSERALVRHLQQESLLDGGEIDQSIVERAIQEMEEKEQEDFSELGAIPDGVVEDDA